MRAGGLGGVFVFLTVSVAAAASPAPPATPQTVAVYVYPEDAGASAIASRANEVLVRAAAAQGYRSTPDPRAGDLLDRSADDLLHAAASLAAGRAAFKEGLEENSRLRLDAAQEALLRANSAFLDAAAAPSYAEMRDVHLYLGVVAVNLGQPDVAQAQFRTVCFFAPGYVINRNTFPPSIVNAFEQARATIATRAKGSLRIEADKAGALVFVDGVLKGSIPRQVLDLPEGTHYLEVRAPNVVPQLLAVQVAPVIETPVLVSIRTASTPVRRTWSDPSGEAAAAAIARILDVDRLVIASARTTITGVSPYAVRGATFDPASGRRTTTAEIATARDLPTTDARLAKLAKELFRASQGYSGVSWAATVAARSRIFAPYELRVALEAGGAFMNHAFDSQGRSFATSSYGQIEAYNPDHGFDRYTEERTALHVRYGLRERTTVFLDLPFYAKQLVYDFDADSSGTVDPGEQGTKRHDEGVGDVRMGADIRIPAVEGRIFSLFYLTTHAKLPTGNANADGFLRQYNHLAIGSGQTDLYGGVCAVVARGDARLGFEAGYNARLPDTVPYFFTNRALNLGDEQRLRTEGGYQVGRWLSLEISGDLLHRNATRYFVDPVSHQLGKTREMALLTAGAAIRAEFSERVDGGIAVEVPAWGKSTLTLFPIDVTGPRAYLYYGVRF